MPEPTDVDAHLGAVLAELIDAIQELKQGLWVVHDSERRGALEELRAELIAGAATVADAEAAIGGRAPGLAAPTGHRPRNLAVEVGGDADALVDVVVRDVQSVVDEIRAHARALEGAPPAEDLHAVADAVEHQLERFRRI